MPLPNRAFGRPGTPVFPPGWETDHAQVIGNTHTATVTVGLPGQTPTWNPTTNQTESLPADPIYDGPASLALLGVDGSAPMATTVDELLSQRRYDVTLEWDASGVTDKHVVHVTESTDPDLVGRTLTIDAVGHGSSRFARHIVATLT